MQLCTVHRFGGLAERQPNLAHKLFRSSVQVTRMLTAQSNVIFITKVFSISLQIAGVSLDHRCYQLCPGSAGKPARESVGGLEGEEWVRVGMG